MISDMKSEDWKVFKYAQAEETKKQLNVTQEDLLNKFSELIEAKRDMLSKKNKDYADMDHAFSNFEGSAHIAGVKPEQVFMTLIGVKVERLRELMGSNSTPQCEKVEDTLQDLSNYADLFQMYLFFKGQGDANTEQFAAWSDSEKPWWISDKGWKNIL